MSVTLLENLINPEVMADMISAELEKKLRATQFYRVDRTLTGRAGDTITVPSWLYIGAAEDVAENAPVPLREMKTEDISYTVKKAAIDITLTDESVLSGYGDPVGQAARQLRMSIQDKMDDDGIALLEAVDANIGHVHEATGNIDQVYYELIDAMDLLKKDNEEQGINTFFIANSKKIKEIRKSDFFIELPTMMGDAVIKSGVVRQIGGAQVVISNKVSDNRGYILTPQCLTAFMKRDINIECERQMEFRRTRIGVDAHYVIAIEDFDKIVAINFGVMP
jgi:N4-gp56 family major capsid protein